MSVSNQNSIKFEIISPGGPTLAYHAGCVINKCLYVHGGIDRPGSKTPLKGLYEYSPSTGIWSDLTSQACPSLSYHTCVSLSNRYFVLIGGWNGKARVSDVNVFDTKEKKWLECKTTGFPTGSGLSSHTANLLKNGDVLIIGREGFLKTQRRFASMFVLSCRISDRTFKYTQLETTVGSRSGHTCDMIGTRLFIMGGRGDNLMETHPFSSSGASKLSNVTFKGQPADSNKPLKIITRKYHATAICNSGTCILLHGGWSFDGKHKQALSECYLLQCKPSVEWTYLGESSVHLSGHIMCEDEDRILVHGGENNSVKCTLYQILPTR